MADRGVLAITDMVHTICELILLLQQQSLANLTSSVCDNCRLRCLPKDGKRAIAVDAARAFIAFALFKLGNALLFQVRKFF